MQVETAVPLDDWRAVGAAAREAEDAGFDGLVSMEIAADPFAPLAFAAVATERIRLGTGIVGAFPRSPMVVAQMAWDLQRQSGGRFHLGLGSQVKGHNVRRFSVPWGPPAPRLREYVESLRAIWRCWELREPLRYQGEHYQFTLMTPEFSPPPTGLPPVPVSIAAVGPAMSRVAARVCDGVRLHGFATRRYLEQVTLPEIERRLSEAGRDRSQFEIWGGGFVATGADADELRASVEAIRYRIAFYGSTRSYHGALAAHGWEELGHKLHAMSKRGQWKRMAAEVPDEVLHSFAAVGRYGEIAKAIEDRFGGIVDTLPLRFGPKTPPGLVRELVQDIQRIPARFCGHATGW
jgi:probable F420-dependent oxidoreductase